MDNAIVGATGAVCFLVAQVSTGWVESVTPLTIIAVVVYYFLYKFDKKLDSLEDKTEDIHEKIKQMAGADNGAIRPDNTNNDN